MENELIESENSHSDNLKKVFNDEHDKFKIERSKLLDLQTEHYNLKREFKLFKEEKDANLNKLIKDVENYKTEVNK